MSQLVVGLTGGIGSGKTAVSDRFAAKGITVVDADVIARQVVEPGSKALSVLREHFGPQALDEHGGLNRAYMREQVFSNPQNKHFIDNLLHPLIRTEMLKQTAAAQSPYCILSVPLLVENQLNSLVDRVLVVDVSPATQLQRAANRDSQTQGQVQKIMDAQVSRDVRLAAADDVIDNNGDLLELHQQVEKFHNHYLKLVKIKAKG